MAKRLAAVPEDRGVLGIAQPGGGENVVDRRLGPGKWVVGPHYDLAHADLGDQVAQPLGVKTIES
jgi:hypothetical protein